MPTRRVLIVHPILYHYRRAVFRELDSRREIEAVFAADTAGRDGISVMAPEDVKRFVPIRARRFGPVETHSGLIKELLRTRYQEVVFLGDAKVLTTWVAAPLARLRGARVHFWTIGWHRPEAGLKRLFRLAFYRLADSLLVYGRIGAGIGIALGYPRDRVTVIGNSVAPSESAVDSPDLVLPAAASGELWLGAVIRLNPRKRLDVLIRAAAALRAQGRDARVLLVGDGPARQKLLELAADLGVPAALPGAAYSPRDLAKVYELLDITVVPAAIGLTAIQSLSHGTPAISDDDKFAQMPEWEAIVPGVTGDTYTAGSTESLVKAIERVAVRLEADPQAVSTACRAEIARRWTPVAHADRIIEALTSS